MMDMLHAMPAEDYFRHKEPPPAIMESVQNDARPYLAQVGGPGVWDVKAHPVLPLLGFFKTNTRDNADMPSTTHWQLLFTAPGREDLAVVPWFESDKLPLPERPAASPPPPGSRPKITYSFREEWRDVAFSRLPPGPKSWKVALLAGNFLSNTLDIGLAGIDPPAPASDAASGPLKPASAWPEADRKRFTARAGDAPIPESGVAFAPLAFSGTDDEPELMLRGSFRLPDPPPSHSEAVRLHLLFTGPEIPGGLRQTIAVPMAFAATDGKKVQGRFGLDLVPLFRGPSGKVRVPAELYVTPVRGTFIGQPLRLETGKPHR
jgi:hypothetical protein